MRSLALAERANSRVLVCIRAHREYTILLSRERVNKRTKRMNSLFLTPVVISKLTRFYRENRSLQVTKLVPRSCRAQQIFFVGLYININSPVSNSP